MYRDYIRHGSYLNTNLPLVNPGIASYVSPFQTLIVNDGTPEGRIQVMPTVLNPLVMNDPDGNRIVIPGQFPVMNPVGPVNPLSVRSLTNPNDDPELHHRVIKYYYNRLKTYYLPDRFSSLLDYVVVEGGKCRLVNSKEELNNNKPNNVKDKVEYILEYIFGKYDVENILNHVVYKHGLNWYELQTKHASYVKSGLYYGILKKINKQLDF